MKQGLKRSAAALLFCAVFAGSVWAGSVTYTVRSGDTLWKIASRYGVSLAQLRKANPSLGNSTIIWKGQKLTIPDNTGSSVESQVITLVNRERAKRGLAALKGNTQLSYVAGLKAKDMAARRYFSHTSPTYGSPFTMMQKYGLRFSAAGENIAMGQTTAQQVMNDWMNSPGHRANILSAAYTQIGVGCAKSSNGVLYWTQEFIKPL